MRNDHRTRRGITITGMLLLMGGILAGCREEQLAPAPAPAPAPALTREPVASIVIWGSSSVERGYVDLDTKVAVEICRLVDEAKAAKEGWLHDDSFTRLAVSGQLYLQKDGVVRQFVMSSSTLFLVEENRWRHLGGPLIERVMAAYLAGSRGVKPNPLRPEWMARAESVVKALEAAGIPSALREDGSDLAAPWVK